MVHGTCVTQSYEIYRLISNFFVDVIYNYCIIDRIIVYGHSAKQPTANLSWAQGYYQSA